MRSILDKTDAEKQKRIYSSAIGIFIIAVMALSTIGYSFMSSEEDSAESQKKIDYNGIEFRQAEEGLWEFEKDGYLFKTRYLPSETGNATASITKTIRDYSNQVLYVGINSKEDISQEGNREIYQNLEQVIARANFACLSENCTEDYPVKDCANDNIIVFKRQQDNSGASGTQEAIQIKEEGKCVIIYSQAGNAGAAADEFIFRLLGIK